MSTISNPNALPNGKRLPESVTAQRHGFLSSRVLCDYEHAEGFEDLRLSLMESWQPANAQEELLVVQIAQASWRMQRFTRMEASAFDLMLRKLAGDVGATSIPHGDEGLYIAFGEDKGALDRQRRCMAQINREYLALMNQLMKLQALRDGATPKSRPNSRTRACEPSFEEEKAVAAGSTASTPAQPAASNRKSSTPARSLRPNRESEKAPTHEMALHRKASDHAKASLSEIQQPPTSGLRAVPNSTRRST
jgi:hypothetical protein